jgi:hypothetical protein
LTVRWKKFSDEGKTVHFGWRYHGEFIPLRAAMQPLNRQSL